LAQRTVVHSERPFIKFPVVTPELQGATLRFRCVLKQRDKMRKLILAVAAIVTVGIAVPAATSTPASAKTIIIKKGGHHGGWHPHMRPHMMKRGHH
jgi:hypothetical protein